MEYYDLLLIETSKLNEITGVKETVTFLLPKGETLRRKPQVLVSTNFSLTSAAAKSLGNIAEILTARREAKPQEKLEEVTAWFSKESLDVGLRPSCVERVGCSVIQMTRPDWMLAFARRETKN